jgi:two-component system nitrate/nitrite sensor histidine kinase NarX
LLREKEAQYRSIFEATSDGMVIREPTGRIVEVNPAYCQMHDISREEIIGTTHSQPLDPEQQQLFDRYLATVNAGNIFRSQHYQIDRSGRRIPVEGLGIPFSYRGTPHILAVVRDISDRVQAIERAEQRAEERTRELAALLDVSRQVASTLDLGPLLRMVLTKLRAVLPYTAATFNLREGVDRLTLMLYEGPLPQSILPKGWSIAPPRPQGTFLTELINEAVIGITDPQAFGREVIYNAQPVIIPDVAADTPLASVFRSRLAALLDGVVPEYIGCWMGVPLIYRDEVIGMLDFDHEHPGTFTERHARLAMAAASQAAVAIANARLLAEVQGQAAQEERERLARDLHDAVTQQLFSASLIGEVLPQIWSVSPAKGEEYLEDLRLLTKGALAEMRALLVELRPAALTDTPLQDLLQHLTTAIGGRARIQADLQVVGEVPLPDAVQVALYRVAQEALNNIAKYAHARHAWVKLHLAHDVVMLEIRDDGRGFDPEAVSSDHFGLSIMHERMASVGGTLVVESQLGQGTVVVARWTAG